MARLGTAEMIETENYPGANILVSSLAREHLTMPRGISRAIVSPAIKRTERCGRERFGNGGDGGTDEVW